MNKTVALVNEWASFESKHQNCTIEDFCRYYLTQKQKKKKQGKLLGGVIPPQAGQLLGKIMGRITTLFHAYSNLAFEGIALKKYEDFAFLNTIHQLKEPRKTEVIYHNISELSTGIDALNRLKDMGYISEKDDPKDKRSKRVMTTAKGEKVLYQCYNQRLKVSEMFFQEMAENDIKLCIQLLKNIEIRFSSLWQQHKGKSFKEIYKNTNQKV